MNYSIITPTKNEAGFIEKTIESVISQEVRPEEWIIMDDGSVDNTQQLIDKYISGYPFIKYIKLIRFREELKSRGGRVAAIINYADSLRKTPVDIIAKIDADIAFDRHFFSGMLREFEKDPSLGIASGHMVENGIAEKIYDRASGRGASLLIRYNCYLQIGRFYESRTRGEDDMAYVAARAIGWKTRTLDYYFDHLKPIGSRHSPYRNHFETGYYKGAIPYWFPFFLGTCLRDLFLKPYFLGAFIQLYAYFISRFLVRYKPFPSFVTSQLRQEQKNKLIKIVGL